MFNHMPANYDHFMTHGYRHKCVCGHFWYDSDGGPCHATCARCDKVIVVEDSLQDKDGDLYCDECAFICSSCGEVSTDDIIDKERPMCCTCQEFFNAVHEASLEDLPLYVGDDLPRVAKELLAKRLLIVNKCAEKEED
jgi:hypothetical protein